MLKQVIYAATLNIDKALTIKLNKLKLEYWLWPFVVIALSWSYLFSQIIFQYRLIENMGEKIVIGLKCFSYSLSYILIVTIITSFFIKRLGSYSYRYYISMLANMPVFVISIITLFFQITYHQNSAFVNMIGFFPEHGFVLAGFFMILSNLKLIGRIYPKLAIAYLPLILFLQYTFMIIIFYRIFNI